MTQPHFVCSGLAVPAKTGYNVKTPTNTLLLKADTFNIKTMTSPSHSEISHQVQQSLNEDLGVDTDCDFHSQDVTASLISESKESTAQLICREKAILCGRSWFDTAFNLLNISNHKIKIKWYFEDGQKINNNDVICEVTGNARQILIAERTALNFLQTLSSTATQTHAYTKAIEQTGCKILDTRKTIPGLRLAQKYAVACGGGVNHRIGLYDMVLIKENHIHAAGSISAAVNKARNDFKNLKIEVEVENIDELKQAIDAKVDRILLDNMSIPMLKESVSLNNKQIDLEASGNITLQTIGSIAETGVDYISTGAITKNINAIDFSLRFVDEK